MYIYFQKQKQQFLVKLAEILNQREDMEIKHDYKVIIMKTRKYKTIFYLTFKFTIKLRFYLKFRRKKKLVVFYLL